MNEKRIREVIEIEKRAVELVAQANREAEQMPIDAEAQASAIVEGARATAQDEAKHIAERAQGGEESSGIISQAEQRMSKTTTLADKNMEKAVEFVMDRVLART